MLGKDNGDIKKYKIGESYIKIGVPLENWGRRNIWSFGVLYLHHSMQAQYDAE